ncbi:MAG: CDP-alcohol phosphatidyltransferase family protein [Pseudomonadota bacterium]
MLDGAVKRLFDPLFSGVARSLARTGLSANFITLTAVAVGLAVLIPLTMQNYLMALALIAVNRVLDALDGAVARRNGITDLGGFFDVVGDFIFFGAVVLGFALAEPENNALAASWLLFSFMGTEASFLAYAALAEKHHFHSESHGQKSIFFLGGLVEGVETVAVFVLACIFPRWFPWIAVIFGVLCWMTTGARVMVAIFTLPGGTPPPGAEIEQDEEPIA